MRYRRSQATGLLGCLGGIALVVMYIALFAVGLALAAGIYWLLGMAVVYLADYFFSKHYEVFPCALAVFVVTCIIGTLGRAARSGSR